MKAHKHNVGLLVQSSPNLHRVDNSSKVKKNGWSRQDTKLSRLNMDSTDWDSEEEGNVTCTACKRSINRSSFKSHWTSKHLDVSDQIPRDVLHQIKQWHNRRCNDKTPLETGRPHDLSAAFHGYSTGMGDDELSVQDFEEMQETIEIFPNAGNSFLSHSYLTMNRFANGHWRTL